MGDGYDNETIHGIMGDFRALIDGEAFFTGAYRQESRSLDPNRDLRAARSAKRGGGKRNWIARALALAAARRVRQSTNEPCGACQTMLPKQPDSQS